MDSYGCTFLSLLQEYEENLTKVYEQPAVETPERSSVASSTEFSEASLNLLDAARYVHVFESPDIHPGAGATRFA